MAYENYVPVVEVTRGPIVESVHFGAAVVVDSAGSVVASGGRSANDRLFALFGQAVPGAAVC